MRPNLSVSAFVLVFVLLVAIAGCGGDGETTTVTETETQSEAAGGGGGEGEQVAALNEAVTSLREEVGGEKGNLPQEEPPPSFQAVSCGSGVYAKKSTTSCAFALNVARDFFAAPGYRFYSYSPVTGKTYLVRCTRSYPVLCRAGTARVVIT
jgi:hypothetical protein